MFDESMIDKTKALRRETQLICTLETIKKLTTKLKHWMPINITRCMT